MLRPKLVLEDASGDLFAGEITDSYQMRVTAEVEVLLVRLDCFDWVRMY